MKTFLASALFILTGSLAFAAEPEVLKTCSTLLKVPAANGNITEESVRISFLKSGAQLTARITKADGSIDEESALEEHSVRPDLKKVTLENIDQFDLNLAESLVAHAMQVTADPILGSFMSVDFDLTLVRSAKVYMVGKRTNLGLAAVVEAKDASGKVLGSYFGGFLVSPCK